MSTGQDEECWTLEELDAHIKEKEKWATEMIEKYDPYNPFNNSYANEVRRLKTLREFVETGVPFEYCGDHVVLFDKYLATLNNKRWRVVGKNKWYYYKNAEDLLTRYLLKDTQQKFEDTPNEY
jgi:hypothetical protein